MGWDSSVGIATRYGPDVPGIESWWGASDCCRFSLLDEQTARAMMPEPSGTSAVPINTDNPPEEAYDYVSGREHQYSQCPPQCHAVVTQSCAIQEAPPNSCIIGSSRYYLLLYLKIPFLRKQE
jgi:hypothetical protein